MAKAVGSPEQTCPDLVDAVPEVAVSGSHEGLLVGQVLGREDVENANDVGALGPILLQPPSEQLLAHQLVERLVEHPLDVDEFRPEWPVGSAVVGVIAADSSLVVSRIWRARR